MLDDAFSVDNLPEADVLEQTRLYREKYEAEWKQSRRGGDCPSIAKHLLQSGLTGELRRFLLQELLFLDCHYCQEFPQTDDYVTRLSDDGLLLDGDATWIDDVLRRAKQPHAVDHGVGPTGDFVGTQLSQSTLTLVGYSDVRSMDAGGMGAIYKAWDQELAREVAVKTLISGMSIDRFVNESKITARLQQFPGIPPVYVLANSDQGQPCLVMKWIDGETMAKLLGKRSGVDVDQLLFIDHLQQIAKTVGFAHTMGIIHRDLKPANIMVDAHGQIQVMDWGLGKIITQIAEGTPGFSAEPASDGLTSDGIVMGTVNYMAPEQARGEEVDARADVFALGGILSVILTGKPAFVFSEDADWSSKIHVVASGDVSEIWQRLERCGADQPLIDIAKGCLQPEPHQRYSDAEQVAKAIKEYQIQLQQRVKTAETERAEALVRLTEQRKRRRVWMGLATTFLVGLVASLLFARWARNSDNNAHQRLVDLLVANARREWESGNFSAALGWFSSALSADEKRRPEQAELHRARVISTLNMIPKPDQILEHPEGVSWAEFDRDGSRIVTAFDKRIFLWDRESGNLLRECGGFDDPIVRVGFLGVGDQIFVVTQQDIFTCNSSSLAVSQRMAISEIAEDSNAQFVGGWCNEAGDRLLLVVNSFGQPLGTAKIAVWSPTTKTIQRFPPTESGLLLQPSSLFGLKSFSFKPDGSAFAVVHQRIVGVDQEKQSSTYLGVWSVAENRLVAEIGLKDQSVRCLSIGNSSPLVAVISADDRLQLWKYSENEVGKDDNQSPLLSAVWPQPVVVPPLTNLVEFNADDTNLSLIDPAGQRQISVADGSVLPSAYYPVLQNEAQSVRLGRTVTRDHQYYLEQAGRNLRIMNAAGFYPAVGQLALNAPIAQLRMHDAGGLATTQNYRGQLTLWKSLDDPSAALLANGHRDHRFSPSDRSLAILANDGIHFFDAEGKLDGESIDLASSPNRYQQLRYSSDGEKIAVFASQSLRVFEAKSRLERLALPILGTENTNDKDPPGPTYLDFDFTKDGQQLAVVSSEEIVVFDIDSRKERLKLALSDEEERFLATQFSPDGRWLLTRSTTDPTSIRHKLRLWNSTDGSQVRLVTDCLSLLPSIDPNGIRWRFSHDGKQVYAMVAEPRSSGEYFVAVRRWNVFDGSEIQPPLMDLAGGADCTLVHNDQYLVVHQVPSISGPSHVFYCSRLDQPEPAAEFAIDDLMPPPKFAVSDDGDLVAFSSGRTARVVAFDTMEPVSPQLNGDGEITELQFESGTHRLLAIENAENWGRVRIWQFDSTLPSEQVVALADRVSGMREEHFVLRTIEGVLPAMDLAAREAAGVLLKTTQNQELNYHWSQAGERQKSLDWEQAARHWTEVVDRLAAQDMAPQRAIAFAQRGFCRVQQAEFKAAEVDYQKASKLAPDTSMNYAWLAYLQRVTHRPDESLANAKMALQANLDSTSLPYPGWLAETIGYDHLALGNWNDAAASFAEAHRQGLSANNWAQKFEALRALALLLIKTGRLEEFRALRRELIERYAEEMRDVNTAEVLVGICCLADFSREDVYDQQSGPDDTVYSQSISVNKPFAPLFRLARFVSQQLFDKPAGWTVMPTLLARVPKADSNVMLSINAEESFRRSINDKIARDTPITKDALLLALSGIRQDDYESAARLLQTAKDIIHVEQEKSIDQKKHLDLLEWEVLADEIESLLVATKE